MTKKNRIVKIQLVKNNTWIADQCDVAETFFSRLKGLIGRKMLRQGQGLLLSPCNDIHMLMMSISIDVIFVRKEKLDDGREAYQVTSFRENLRPWGLLPVRDGRASCTLELPVGTIQRCEVRVGDELCIS